MAEEQNYVGYIAFRKGNGGPGDQVRILNTRASGDLSKVQAWMASFSDDGPADTGDRTVDDPPEQAESNESETSGPPEQLAKLMEQYRAAISGFHELIRVNGSLIPMIRRSFIEHQLLKTAQRDMTVLSEDNNFILYGASDGRIAGINQKIDRLKEIDKGFSVLPGAILLSLVATFDSYIAETVRQLLVSRPERYENSDKTIPVKAVLSMGSFDEVLSSIIDDEIDALMRGSHEEQVRFIEKTFNIEIRDKYGKWSSFSEIFERRNIAAHGNLIANKHYIGNCKRHGFDVADIEIGDSLDLDAEYLSAAVDTLLEFGILLMTSLWRKNFTLSDDDVYEIFSYVSYGLIRDKRPRVAASLLNFALEQKLNISENLRKVMTVNLANASKKLGDSERCAKILADTDWSASSERFRISVAALNGDAEEFLRLMDIAGKAEIISKEEFREWPVFDWVRDDERIQTKFQEIFGEPMVLSRIESSGASQVESDKATEPSE